MVVPSPWVWRHDGTLQCGLGSEQTLDEARAQLEAVIGADNVIGGEKRQLPGPVIALCGAATGQVNAFQLTPHGFWLLFHGIVGPIGFRPWMDEAADAQAMTADGGVDIFPWQSLASVKDQQLKLVGTGGGAPCCIEDLYGRLCRVYNVGDPLTEDYRPERFNVGLVNDRIKELWFG